MNYAVLAALSYWIIWVLDNMTGVQTLSRPIIIGTFTGLLCGDIKTGIILGATLEAVFLGIVGVGGVSVSDPRYRCCTSDWLWLRFRSSLSHRRDNSRINEYCITICKNDRKHDSPFFYEAC